MGGNNKVTATAGQLLQYPNFSVGLLLAEHIDRLDQGELVAHQGKNMMNGRCGPHLFRVGSGVNKQDNMRVNSRSWFGILVDMKTLDAIASAIAGGNQFTLPPFLYYHSLRREERILFKLHLGCRKKDKFRPPGTQSGRPIPYSLCRSFFHCMAGTVHLNNQSFHMGCVGATITADGLQFKIECACCNNRSRMKSFAMHNPTLGMCFTCVSIK